MTEADRIFARFSPFIKDYIYKSGWQTLHDVQLDAARVIFDSEDNLLLSSSTASGKTEAALFPILTRLAEDPTAVPSVSVLYIAPLKSLINDQFHRLETVLEESGIPVTHWHGDVSSNAKKKLLQSPAGILQITPESLESMLLRRKNDIPRIFGGLRYVILDEIHTLIGNDRGSQILCQLTRLSHLIGYSPRRIGLSATIGDLSAAAEWLGSGSGRLTQSPPPPPQKCHWRLGLAHFYNQNPEALQTKEALTASGAVSLPTGASQTSGRAALDPGYEFLYDTVAGRKALVFSNSREETEYVTATLRQIAKKRGDPDIFYIHHGNLSASLREDAELVMKDESIPAAVACATVTLERGIDIGRLQRVAEVGAPTTVSSLLQRLGRSGRRNDPPEMVMLFREDTPLPTATLPELIPWELLRGIAVVELYRKERFIEPPKEKNYPFSLAFHQTLSFLASSGEKRPKDLAQEILALPPLSHLSPEDYRSLLLSMVENDFLEMTEERTLIPGLSGERLLNSYKFYAVFKDSEDFTVRCGSDEIGTITTPPPVGDRFALAGRVWEVTDCDLPRRLVYVKGVEGKMEISWPGDAGEIHTKVLLKMRDVLFSEEEYPYLLPNAKERLAFARSVARKTGMDQKDFLSVGGQSYVLFPWLGTRGFRAIRRYLQQNADRYGISDVRSEGCCYLTLKAQKADAGVLISKLRQDLAHRPIEPLSLIREGECPVFDKYDDFIPAPLLQKAYAYDRLDAEEARQRMLCDLR